MLTSSVTLGKFFKPSEPSFPRVLVEDDSIFLMVLGN